MYGRNGRWLGSKKNDMKIKLRDEFNIDIKNSYGGYGAPVVRVHEIENNNIITRYKIDTEELKEFLADYFKGKTLTIEKGRYDKIARIVLMEKSEIQKQLEEDREKDIFNAGMKDENNRE